MVFRARARLKRISWFAACKSGYFEIRTVFELKRITSKLTSTSTIYDSRLLKMVPSSYITTVEKNAPYRLHQAISTLIRIYKISETAPAESAGKKHLNPGASNGERWAGVEYAALIRRHLNVPGIVGAPGVF